MHQAGTNIVQLTKFEFCLSKNNKTTKALAWLPHARTHTQAHPAYPRVITRRIPHSCRPHTHQQCPAPHSPSNPGPESLLHQIDDDTGTFRAQNGPQRSIELGRELHPENAMMVLEIPPQNQDRACVCAKLTPVEGFACCALPHCLAHTDVSSTAAHKVCNLIFPTPMKY